MSECLNIKITGNPFIDSGIYALKTKLNKDISDIAVNDLRKGSIYISKLYSKKLWNRNMHKIFPNSKLVNNQSKGNPQEIYLDELNKLINNIEDFENEGFCIGCGIRKANNSYYKKEVPLTGSGSLINYFSFGKSGADYCSLCVLLIQFSPLIMYHCGGKMIVLHSNSEKVMKFWAKISPSFLAV